MSDVAADPALRTTGRPGPGRSPLDEGEAARLAALVATDRPADREVVSPLDGSVVGRVPVCTVDDVAAAAARVRVAQRASAARPGAGARGGPPLRFAALVMAEQARLMDLAVAEAGKAGGTRRELAASRSGPAGSPRPRPASCEPAGPPVRCRW